MIPNRCFVVGAPLGAPFPYVPASGLRTSHLENGVRKRHFLHRFPTMRHLNGTNPGRRDDATAILVTH